MKYFLERSLYYAFLMQELIAGSESFKFVAKLFGLKPRQIKEFEKVLNDGTLAELDTVENIEMYKNYLNGFCKQEKQFGLAQNEELALEMKALALHKVKSLFGEMPVKANRLRTLSHTYENDHVGAVLYALYILMGVGGGANALAEEILLNQFHAGRNSDAGIILLKLKGNKKETLAELSAVPDMVLMPEVIKFLGKLYGCKNCRSEYRGKRSIGFN